MMIFTLVSCPINNLLDPPADFCTGQGVPTSHSGYYAEEAQRRPVQKRRGAASKLFIGQDTGLLYTNKIGVRQHQPLRALPLEIDLDSSMRSIALEIEH